jgi:hypothetical protein
LDVLLVADFLGCLVGDAKQPRGDAKPRGGGGEVAELAKLLGMRALSAAELAALIGAVASGVKTSSGDQAVGGAAAGSDAGRGGAAEGVNVDEEQRAEAAAALAALYCGLLRVSLNDVGAEGEAATRHQQRWQGVLEVGGQGCWPEICRRILLARSAGKASCIRVCVHEFTTWQLHSSSVCRHRCTSSRDLMRGSCCVLSHQYGIFSHRPQW